MKLCLPLEKEMEKVARGAHISKPDPMALEVWPYFRRGRLELS